MRKVCLSALLLAMCALPAFAQDSKVDIFGGYSYLRAEPGSGLPGVNTNGWEASLTYNWNNWLGLKADVDGHYCCGDAKEHDFLFGPQISLGHGKLAPYVHGLVGASHGSATGFSDTVFAFALGGGVDVKVTDLVGIRVGQFDYFGTRYSGYTQNNFRFSTGLVFHFGRK